MPFLPIPPPHPSFLLGSKLGGSPQVFTVIFYSLFTLFLPKHESSSVGGHAGLCLPAACAPAPCLPFPTPALPHLGELSTPGAPSWAVITRGVAFPSRHALIPPSPPPPTTHPGMQPVHPEMPNRNCFLRCGSEALCLVLLCVTQISTEWSPILGGVEFCPP